MRLLLDTASLIHAIESPERLSRRAATLIQNPENLLELSSISLVEIAIKTATGKLSFSIESVRQAISDLDLRILPFSADHAYTLFELPTHHRDPFDRQIIAQSLWEGIPVLTPDEKFQLYKGVKVIW